MLKLTDQGRKEVSNFVQKCEEFRKELLETGRDTGHIGPPERACESDAAGGLDQRKRLQPRGI